VRPAQQVVTSCYYSIFGVKNMDIRPFLPLYLTISQTISNSYLGPTPIAIFVKNEALPPLLSLSPRSDSGKHARRDPDGSISSKLDKGPVHA
jgi:hypothetical protein